MNILCYQFRKMFLAIMFSSCLLFVGSHCYASGNLLTQQIIRIAIVKEADQVVLSVLGRYEIVDPVGGALFSKGRRMRRETVIPTLNGIQVGEDEYLGDRIRIVTPKDVLIHVGKKKHRFRGEIEIIKGEDQKLLVVNLLDVERYVKGVLYHEVTNRWPLESLKAQAVAARTYAFYRIKDNDGQAYDITSDIYSQVYGGRNSERYRTNIAVNRTKGLVLTYQDEILPAYYHSSCGGSTEDVSELWEQDLAPLKGRACSFCKGLPSYKWKKNYRLKDFESKLKKHGYKLDLIKEINILSKNKSGRIGNLEIVTRRGRKIKISGKKFRDIIGPNIIKSNKYDITMRGYYVDLIGNGWGHGVGMCQWGAHAMSKERYKYDEILNYYYPGAEIMSCLKKDCSALLIKEDEDAKE